MSIWGWMLLIVWVLRESVIDAAYRHGMYTVRHRKIGALAHDPIIQDGTYKWHD